MEDWQFAVLVIIWTVIFFCAGLYLGKNWMASKSPGKGGQGGQSPPE